MKIVIQCAGRKQYDAGSLLSSDGRPIMFVAHPEKAPLSGNYSYARPDGISDDGRTWRERLVEYNQKCTTTNQNRILPAYQLYLNPAYKNLVDKFGLDHVFILTAGWGLIPAKFLTPVYDITFSASGQPFNKRGKRDQYQDFNMLPDDGDDIVFLGGKSYLPLFRRLTADRKGRKIILYNSMNRPDAPDDFEPKLYKTNRRTNWHYECANVLINEEISV